MPAVTLDLPADVLDAVNLLARQYNVSRTEIFARAVGMWGRVEALEEALASHRDRLAEGERRSATLTALEARARAAARAATAGAEALRDELRVTLRGKRLAEAEIRVARDRAALAEARAGDARREAAAAEGRARAAEERDLAKSAEAARDAEVVRLRDHARELAVRMQRLETDLAHRAMETRMAVKKAAAAATRATAAERRLPPLTRQLAQSRKSEYAAERQIGVLLKDRAALREALRKLARELARAGTPAAKPPRRV